MNDYVIEKIENIKKEIQTRNSLKAFGFGIVVGIITDYIVGVL